MDLIDRLFGSKAKDAEFDKIVSKIAIDTEEPDSWSYESLATQDLTRSNFKYEKLVELGWWPDKLLKFIQVNRLAYLDVMHLYDKYTSLFDRPLRIFIAWVKANNKLPPDLAASRKTLMTIKGNIIPDRYWNHVLHEDNCYMYQFEEHERHEDEDVCVGG